MINKKNTLLKYYEALPKATYPKKDFIWKIMVACNVTQTTVRNWIWGNSCPQEEEYRQRVAEITGIPQEELWQQEQ